MDTTTQITTDHEKIRNWADSRKGQPAIKDGKIFISFSPSDGDPIYWEEFFRRLDDENLAFMYRDGSADGDDSKLNTFNEVVDRSQIDETHTTEGGEPKKSGGGLFGL